MRNDLRKIIWNRSKLFILGLATLIIGYSLLFTWSCVSNWTEKYEYQNSSEEKKDYDAYKKNQEKLQSSLNNTYKKYGATKEFWLYVNQNGITDAIEYDKVKDQYTLNIDSFDSYRRLDLNLINKDSGTESNPADIIYSGYFLFNAGPFTSLFSNVILLIFAAAGFMTFFVDYKTNFINLLFASKFTRKQIIRMKVKVILPLVIASVMIAIGINIGGLYLNIPHSYINLDFSRLIGLYVSYIFLGVMVYFISLFGGIICGQVFTGVFSMFSFYFLSTLMINNINGEIYTRVLSKSSDVQYTMNVYSMFSSYKIWIGMALLYLFIGFIFYALASYFYEKVSMENRNHYILIPSLRWPIIFFGSFYTTVNLFWNSFSYNLTGQIISAIVCFLMIMSVLILFNYNQKITVYILGKLKK